MGVAVVVALDLAIQSSRAAFVASSKVVAGRATHTIRGGPAGLPEALFRTLRVDLGIRASAPVVEGRLTSDQVPGTSLRILGVDPFSERAVRPSLGGSIAAGGVTELLAEPGSVFLSASLAEQSSLTVGDTLTLRAGGFVQKTLVAGLVEPDDALAREGASDLVLTDVSTAQLLLDRVGALSRIDLVLDGDGNGDDQGGGGEARTLAEIRRVLPVGAVVEPAGTRTQTMVQMTRAFDLNLTALSLLAMVFGMFLIYNTMTFSVVQRRELFGALRALGVTGRQIMRVVVLEAVVLALVGSAIGLVAGVFLGRGLVSLVVQTINDLYFSLSVSGLQVSTATLAKGAALGVGATVLASIPASLEAATAPPRRTLRRSFAEESARRLVPRAAGWGVVLFLVGLGLLFIRSSSLGLAFGGLFGVVLGMALTVPLVTSWFARAAAAPLGRAGGLLAAMAARGVRDSMSRTAPALTALVVAVSVTVGLGTMISSFRATVVDWLDHTLQADVYVSLPSTVSSRADGTIARAILDRLDSVDGWRDRSTYRGREFTLPDRILRMIALDLAPDGMGSFRFVDGDWRDVMARFRAGDGLIVSEPYAFRHGVEPGDLLELPGDEGPVGIPVLGVFFDYGSDQGVVILPRSLYDRHWSDDGITSLGYFVSPGTPPSELVDRMYAAAAAGLPPGSVAEDALIIRSNQDLRQGSLEIFDRTFAITGVLRSIAFVVAFIGVLSALMALQLERARELAVLRANGLTPGQVWKLVTAQTGFMGLLAGLLAVPSGLVLALVMILVVNKRSFGWTLHLELGWPLLVQAVGLSLLGALMAGVIPSWRMSRTPPARALRGE
jgi:putative ABC transport system permease protein